MRPEDVSSGPSAPATLINHLAQAEAAIMLLESLMIVMVERKMFSRDELIETVESVVEAKRQMIADRVHPEISTVAAGILSTLANSLASSQATSPPLER